MLGRSNVGKSSLLNALAGTHGLARVSATPGRTRLANFFRVDGVAKPGGRGRGALYLVDLPGYGYSRAPREVRDGFERLALAYLLGREPLRLCVFILDARHEPTAGDLQLRAWLEHHRLPWAVAVNKIDALSSSRGRARLAAVEAGPGRGARFVLPVSAEHGTGVAELWNALRAAAFEHSAEAEPASAEALVGRGDDGR